MRTSNIILSAVVVLAIVVFASVEAIQMKAKYDENDVFIKDLKLFTGSKQFFVKGVNYSPQPLGRNQVPTGGLCSKKINYEGVFYDACIEEDYFDGSENSNGNAPKPDGPWWKAVWERDFPAMKDLGANTIRVYHMVSITKTLIEKYPQIYGQKYTSDYGATHLEFMDAAHAHGLKVITPIVSEEGVLTLHTEEELNRYVEARVDEIGNHPALLMWVVGNELGLYSKPDLRKIVQKMIVKVREYTLQKWNRVIPVTTCEVDLPQSYNLLSDELDVDLFMTNAGYRDVYLNSLWAPDLNNNFTGWKQKSLDTGMPVLIGEFGMHDQDTQTAARPDWVNQQYKSIVQYINDGSIGGLFFQWNEETMKPENQQTMGLIRYTPATDAATGKDSTKEGVFIPDVLNKKDTVFEALQKGLDNSNFKQYSYTNDEYALTKITQTVLDLKTVKPKPFGHWTTGNDPVTSGSTAQPVESSEVENRPSDEESSSSPIYISGAILIAIAAIACIGYVQAYML
jgi:hypothetical protein